MDFTLTEFEGELLDLGRTFAEREIAAVAARAWHEERCPTELLRGLGELGLLGTLVPEKWGGIGSSTVGYVALLEALAAVDPSVAAAWQAHSTIGSLPLLLFGDDDQRQKWLRPLAEGRKLGAFGLTEPGAGSDVRSLRTKAVRVSDGWVLTGQKAFISNAGTDMSFGVTVLARTGEDAAGKPRFGSFIVEQGTAGYTLGPKLRGIGWKGLDTRDLFFDGVWVPDSQVVGEPGGGLAQFLSALEVGRISIAALSLGTAAGALRMALAYAKQPRAVRQPDLQFPGDSVQARRHGDGDRGRQVAHLLRRLAARRGQAVQEGGRHGQAEGEPGRHDRGQRGGAGLRRGGYMLDSDVARFYCDAKVLEIGEGTNEIQHLVIARELGCS